MNHWLNIAFIPRHKPLGGYMALHLGRDLWPNGDLSINYDIRNSEAGCVILLLLQRAGEMFCFPEPWKFSWHKIFYRSGFGRQADFHDFSDGISKLSFPFVSSLLAMDDWKHHSPSAAASFIPEIWIQWASGQCVANFVPTFISCSERSGQWGQENQRLRVVPRWVSFSFKPHKYSWYQRVHGYGE